MVKGTTRQVLVVKGADQQLFEQAIFLVRDEIIAQGGVSEDELLKEAREICKHPQKQISVVQKLLWALAGSIITALFWFISSII